MGSGTLKVKGKQNIALYSQSQVAHHKCGALASGGMRQIRFHITHMDGYGYADDHHLYVSFYPNSDVSKPSFGLPTIATQI